MKIDPKETPAEETIAGTEEETITDPGEDEEDADHLDDDGGSEDESAG
jgi:hypothetical protein